MVPIIIQALYNGYRTQRDTLNYSLRLSNKDTFFSPNNSSCVRDTSLIRTLLLSVLLVSQFEGFHCTLALYIRDAVLYSICEWCRWYIYNGPVEPLNYCTGDSKGIVVTHSLADLGVHRQAG